MTTSVCLAPGLEPSLWPWSKCALSLNISSNAGVDLKKGGVKSQTQIEVYADREDDSTQSQPTPPQRGPDKAKEPVPKVEAETQTTSLVVATPKTEEGSGCSQPSSGAKRGARSVGRRKKTGKRSTARSNDDEYAPSTRYSCVLPCIVSRLSFLPYLIPWVVVKPRMEQTEQ